MGKLVIIKILGFIELPKAIPVVYERPDASFLGAYLFVIDYPAGADPTRIRLEFYKILAAADVLVEYDSVEVYGELYYPDAEEIVEAVEALPEGVCAELFDSMTDEEIQEAVVDAGLCEEIDRQCAHVLRAAIEKACKAAGLAVESLGPCAMWED